MAHGCSTPVHASKPQGQAVRDRRKARKDSWHRCWQTIDVDLGPAGYTDIELADPKIPRLEAMLHEVGAREPEQIPIVLRIS